MPRSRPCETSVARSPTRSDGTVRDRSSLVFGELHEYAAGGRRVQKGDALPFGPNARDLIDQSDPGVSAARERGLEVVDAEADVMNAGSALRDEATDRRLRALRFQE